MKSIYGEHLPELEKAMHFLVDDINTVREKLKQEMEMDPVEHLIYRIKSEESMREKCRRKGLPGRRYLPGSNRSRYRTASA